jgi:beta-glucosidase
MSGEFIFPEGFFWGAATAGHQVEGDNRHSDWWAYEQAGKLPFRSGEACRHLELYQRDFDLARELGQNAHRFSIEWARVEPHAGKFDEGALDHYAAVVQALRARGLEPIVTLHHFVSPAWFTARGGWLAEDGADRFAGYVQRVVERLAPHVRWWLTVNEPTVWAKHAYVIGDWPPCGTGNWRRSLDAIRAMLRGHRLAYRIIHARRPDAMVGLAHSAPFVVPSNPLNPLDRLAAVSRDFGLNRMLFRLIGRPLRNWLDFIGVNYYCRTVVRWAPRGRALLLGEDDERPRPGEQRRFSDIGWEAWSPGFAGMLNQLAGYGLPLMVTENGIATRDEKLRADYLQGHLRALAQAIKAGAPVIGYLHWSLIDNYEWALGFEPRFGLCEVDFTTQERRPRAVARTYAEVCRRNALAA